MLRVVKEQPTARPQDTGDLHMWPSLRRLPVQGEASLSRPLPLLP